METVILMQEAAQTTMGDTETFTQRDRIFHLTMFEGVEISQVIVPKHNDWIYHKR